MRCQAALPVKRPHSVRVRKGLRDRVNRDHGPRSPCCVQAAVRREPPRRSRQQKGARVTLCPLLIFHPFNTSPSGQTTGTQCDKAGPRPQGPCAVQGHRRGRKNLHWNIEFTQTRTNDSYEGADRQGERGCLGDLCPLPRPPLLSASKWQHQGDNSHQSTPSNFPTTAYKGAPQSKRESSSLGVRGLCTQNCSSGSNGQPKILSGRPQSRPRGGWFFCHDPHLPAPRSALGSF